MNRLLVLLVLPAAVVPSAAAADPSLDKLVRPFLAKHCVDCHGPAKSKGDFRVDDLVVDYDSPAVMAHWEEVMNRMTSGDMPPKGRPRPDPAAVARVAEWVSGQLGEAEARRQAAGGERVAFRRLSREEFANTVRDLLGVTYDATDPTGLPEDPDWHGFQRIGSVLSLSPAHVEKYLAAAETILAEALPSGPQPKREVVRWGAFDLRRGSWGRHEKEFRTRGIADKVRADIVPNNGSLDDYMLPIKTTGDYLVRVKLSGLRPAGGRAPRLRLYDATLGRLLVEQDVDAPENAPVTIEFRTHLPAGNHNIRLMNAVPGPNPEERRSRSSEVPNAFTGLTSRVPWQMKFTDDDGKPVVPFLLVDSIEWDGPVLASWPTPAHRQIFFADKAAKDDGYARAVLSRFAERAWRRPVRPGEADRLMGLFARARAGGDDFEAAVRFALFGVLTSKSFLYLEEGDAKASTPRLSDWELASRLSYFLWSTLPDDRLFDLARKGELHRPEVLRAEARRMLTDPRAAAFAASFPAQWLQLRRVGMFTPDRVLYPDYDEYLEKSMVAETVGVFREVLATNAGVGEFLDSDWTMLNERLADHYGIPGVHGEAMRRVALKPEDHRGGILTNASVLGLTSDGTRHRPVHRGVWVLDAVLGKPPPPPPANVPALGGPTADGRKRSVREKLEAHRADPNCAGCHSRIDPLGLAFDQYDAIGRWRTVEAVRTGTGADPRPDPSGELPDGRRFADAAGLKRLLADDADRFAAALAEKLATYALRRGMTFADRGELARVVTGAKPGGYRLASLVEDLVASDLFGKR